MLIWAAFRLLIANQISILFLSFGLFLVRWKFSHENILRNDLYFLKHTEDSSILHFRPSYLVKYEIGFEESKSNMIPI